MRRWVTPGEMSDYDNIAISNGTPGDVLMERAGTAAAQIASSMVKPYEGPVLIWCGPGNNGGDGLVLARLLREWDYDVFAILATSPGKSLSHDCQNNLGRYVQHGGKILSAQKFEQFPSKASLVVDSLLGTGFKGELTGVYAICTDIMKSLGSRILAMDTPSGINGTTGQVDPLTLHADVTVTFAAPKLGLLLPPACDYPGMIFTADIGIHVDDDPGKSVVGLSDAAELLPNRPVDAHKGTFGRVLLIGGSESMPGAPQLMSKGALRSGAGLVTLAVPLSAGPMISGRIPEVLSCNYLPGDSTSFPDPGGFDAAAIGPGMGNSNTTKKMISFVLSKWNIPLVLDADALNVLTKPVDQLRNYGGPLLITPHPGELARLTGCKQDDIKDRNKAAEELSRATGSTILLKGRPSMVFHSDGTAVTIPAGNNGLATGGSGDILTGIVASLMVQGSSPLNAGVLGAYIHGLAADIAVENSSARSLIPSDLSDYLGIAFRMLESGSESSLLTTGGRCNSAYLNQ